MDCYIARQLIIEDAALSTSGYCLQEIYGAIDAQDCREIAVDTQEGFASSLRPQLESLNESGDSLLQPEFLDAMVEMEKHPINLAIFFLLETRKHFRKKYRSHTDSCRRCDNLRRFLGLLEPRETPLEDIVGLTEKSRFQENVMCCGEYLQRLKEGIVNLFEDEYALHKLITKEMYFHILEGCSICYGYTLYELTEQNERYQE